MCRSPLAPRIGLCKIHAVLSYRLCAYLRDALCACAGCPNGGTFCIYRAWRCGHRPLRNSIGKRSVGAGGCPPLCQPTDRRCRACQSGHFLEIALLLPPLAALRRFPRRPAPGRITCGTFVGRAALSPPPDNRRTHGRARGPCPTRYCVSRPERTGLSALTTLQGIS